jgi:hypothetical protein
LLGLEAAGVFLVSLLVSGVSKFSRGYHGRAGNNATLRRVSDPDLDTTAVTIIPAFVVVALDYNAAKSLIISQLVLSVAATNDRIREADRPDGLGRHSAGRFAQRYSVAPGDGRLDSIPLKRLEYLAWVEAIPYAIGCIQRHYRYGKVVFVTIDKAEIPRFRVLVTIAGLAPVVTPERARVRALAMN